MSRTRAHVLAASTLALLAALGAAPTALAADPPAPGTDDCVALVKLDPLVVAAQLAVDNAGATDDLDTLKAALDAQLKGATARLCTGTVETTTPTSTPTTTEPSTPGTTTQPQTSSPSNSTGTLNPTEDDGTTPTTSGDQVTQVPEGSASTGD